MNPDTHSLGSRLGLPGIPFSSANYQKPQAGEHATLSAGWRPWFYRSSVPQKNTESVPNTIGAIPELSVKRPTPLPPGDRMSPISTSGRMKTSAFYPSAPRKVGHDARAFREASRRLGGGESLVARARIRPTLLEHSPTPEPTHPGSNPHVIFREGCPYPESRRSWPAEPWMAERRQLRTSEGLDGRSEWPATGHGQPRPTPDVGVPPLKTSSTTQVI